GEAQLGPERLAEVGQADGAGAEAHFHGLGVLRDDRGGRRLRAAAGRPALTTGGMPAPGRPRRAHARGARRGGRGPWRRPTSRATYSSSRPASTQRRSRPPRLMSPRPANSAGKRRAEPKTFPSRSTYLPVATLPSSTTSHS